LSGTKKKTPELRRIQFIRNVSAILIFPMVAYALYNILAHNILFSITTVGSTVILIIVNLMLLKSKLLQEAVGIILFWIYFMAFISLFGGKIQYYSLMWMVCPPATTYYLLGSKRGLKLNIAFLMLLLLFLLFRAPGLISYRSVANIMFSIVFLCVALYSYEKNVEHSHITLEEKQFELEKISETDSLTGLYNRTWIDRIMEKKFGELAASRPDAPDGWCLMLIDIDHFKNINDNYGHQEGDKALKAVATAILKNMKYCGEVARWGGDELLAFLHGLPPQRIIELAESTRLGVEQLRFENGMKITVSMGLAFYHKGDTYDALLKRADDCLYKAKSLGRNRIEKTIEV
jgi:diguanylate cyclase (GGDEF)-like protein